MNITDIIFDLGGVVLTNDGHHHSPQKVQEFCAAFGITYDGMEQAWQTLWPDYKIGKMSEDEFWRKFLKIAGANTIDVDRAKEIWRKYQHPIEDVFSLLEKLKVHYRLSALANIGKEWYEFKKTNWHLDHYFSFLVTSPETGLAKPDPAIYKILMGRLKVDPSACLMIDDKQNNLVPAKELGMEILLFKTQGQLESDFLAMGIKF